MRETYLTPADVIEELKSRQGLRTQTEFAVELGMTQGHLALVYSGKRKPTEAALELLKIDDAGQLYKRRVK